MTADADGFHQTAVDEVSPGKNIELTQRFDIVVGLQKSQTYLYWKDDLLFELPVSWWVATSQWINSPGYEDGAVRFDRPIYPRCLECHGSYFKSLAPPPNKYDPASPWPWHRVRALPWPRPRTHSTLQFSQPATS